MTTASLHGRKAAEARWADPQDGLMPRPVNRQLSPGVSDGNYDLELQIGAIAGGAPREVLEVAWPLRR